MSKDNTFIRYWALVFLNFKYITYLKISKKQKNNIKTKIQNNKNDLLGMPNLFFKLIFKPYSSQFFFFEKLIRFFFLFCQNSFTSYFIETNSFLELRFEETLFFYSNFNIFSMVFLFKNNFYLFFKYDKTNSKYANDFFVFNGAALVSLRV